MMTRHNSDLRGGHVAGGPSLGGIGERGAIVKDGLVGSTVVNAPDVARLLLQKRGFDPPMSYRVRCQEDTRVEDESLSPRPTYWGAALHVLDSDTAALWLLSIGAKDSIMHLNREYQCGSNVQSVLLMWQMCALQ